MGNRKIILTLALLAMLQMSSSPVNSETPSQVKGRQAIIIIGDERQVCPQSLKDKAIISDPYTKQSKPCINSQGVCFVPAYDGKNVRWRETPCKDDEVGKRYRAFLVDYEPMKTLHDANVGSKDAEAREQLKKRRVTPDQLKDYNLDGDAVTRLLKRLEGK